MSYSDVLCIYHGNCTDGFGAAWAVRHALGDEVEFYPGVYSKIPPDVTGRRVLLVDFSYKRDVLQAMSVDAKSILIIDHHKSAQQDLWDLPAPPTKGFLPDEGVYALFDMERSGASMAWDYFNEEECPDLIRIIEDRDLWRFALEGTRDVQACLFSYPYEFDVWDTLMHTPVSELAKEGAAIERKHLKDLDELLAVCQRRMVIGGYDVPAANLPYTFSSDAGHRMAQGEPFSVCYFDTGDTRFFSLRSAPDGVDVSEIAKLYGGGGHKHAAGFEVPRYHPLATC